MTKRNLEEISNLLTRVNFFLPSEFLGSSRFTLHFVIGLKLSASPSISAKGTLEGHVIPTVRLIFPHYVSAMTPAQVRFGVSAFVGIAHASVFLDLDASATVGFQLNAAANVSTETGKDIGTVNHADASADGCVDIGAGLDVEAGADGSFFGLFKADTKVSLFAQKFEILKVFA
jgi:hypothetical protein